MASLKVAGKMTQIFHSFFIYANDHLCSFTVCRFNVQLNIVQFCRFSLFYFYCDSPRSPIQQQVIWILRWMTFDCIIYILFLLHLPFLFYSIVLSLESIQWNRSKCILIDGSYTLTINFRPISIEQGTWNGRQSDRSNGRQKDTADQAQAHNHRQ